MKRMIPAILLLAVCLSAQSPEFEIESVKSSRPAAPGEPININLGTSPNGTVTLGNATLGDCIKYAYGIVSDGQIIGPDWIKTGDVRFDIIARAPAGTAQDQLLLMLQNLLAGRLKLVLHREQRPLAFLALTVERNGVKFSIANTSGPISLRNGRIIHSGISMPILATLLSRFDRQLVLDMTQLSGLYAVKLEWTPETFRSRIPEGGGAIMLNGESINPNGPSLPTALSEQLGLHLESRKGPVDVLVIDRAEKIPTPN